MSALKTETGNVSTRRILAMLYGILGLVMGACSIFTDVPFDFFVSIVAAAFAFAGATIPDQFNTIIGKQK